MNDETTPNDSTGDPEMMATIENESSKAENGGITMANKSQLTQQRQRFKSSQEVWEDLRQTRMQSASKRHLAGTQNHSVYSFKATGHLCEDCAERDREQLRSFRKLAQDYPNVYSWVYLDPLDFDQRWPRTIVVLFLGISIQVVVPIAIAIQLYEDLNDTGFGLCRHTQESVGFGKLLAFVLSFYFGVVSIISFLGKIRGNAFLLIFCTPISRPRNFVLIVGFIAQYLGLVAANIAEYLLFVSRGQDDYLLLLFTSLTMQSTLNADSANLISDNRAQEAANIIANVFSDDYLGLGPKGEPMSKEISVQLHNFRIVYDGAAMLLFVFSMFLTAAVTYCI